MSSITEDQITSKLTATTAYTESTASSEATINKTITTGTDTSTEFTTPDIDLKDLDIDVTSIPSIDEFSKMDITELTNNVSVSDDFLVTGSGIFDKMMETATKHIVAQFEANRIRGEDYAATYLDIYKTTLSTLIAAWTQRTQSYAQAIAALAQAQLAKANTIKTLIEAKYMPVEAKAKLELLKAQIEAQRNQSQLYAAQFNEVAEKIKLEDAQRKLIEAQTISESIKDDLYRRQIEGYDEEYKSKILKTLLDSWTVAFSVAKDALVNDEEAMPSAFTADAIDDVFNNYVFRDLDHVTYVRSKEVTGGDTDTTTGNSQAGS